MGHRDVTGVSPRTAARLQISDTLLCCGLDPARVNDGELRTVQAEGVRVEFPNQYTIIVKYNGKKLLHTRNVREAQLALMRAIL